MRGKSGPAASAGTMADAAARIRMILKLAFLGIVIGSNNFATALALGALGQARRQGRILLVFAIFEFWVPLVGLAIGRSAAGFVVDRAGWIGPALIAALGAWTLFEAVHPRRDRDRAKLAKWLTSWRGLVTLAAGLSLDNLVIGFSLGLSGIPALVMASVIMTCSVAFSWIALKVGAHAGQRHERGAGAISGGLLLVVAGMAWAGWL